MAPPTPPPPRGGRGGGRRSACVGSPAPLSRPQPQRGWRLESQKGRGPVKNICAALAPALLPAPSHFCLLPVPTLVRLGALRCFFAFGAVPRSARLAAVRVSFQHPGHAQCKWWDMESTHSAGGGSRSSTSGGAVGSSANGGAAWRRARCVTQKPNLRSTDIQQGRLLHELGRRSKPVQRRKNSQYRSRYVRKTYFLSTF